MLPLVSSHLFFVGFSVLTLMPDLPLMLYRVRNRFQCYNHKNYNFLDCDWFKKLLFSTTHNSLAKLLLDNSISQSHSKLQFKSTTHNIGFSHHRNSVQTPKFGLSVFFSGRYETIYAF